MTPMADRPIAANDKRLLDVFGEKAKDLREIRAPLSRSDRTSIINGLGVALPEQYLKWVEIADGFSIGSMKIYGLKDLWSAPRPDGLFYVLGAVEGQADLAVRQDEPSGKLYWLGYETDEARTLDLSLPDIIEHYGTAH